MIAERLRTILFLSKRKYEEELKKEIDALKENLK